MSKKDDTEAAIEAAKPTGPVQKEITLDTPIIRGEQKIEKVLVRKPQSGELRGLSLSGVLQLEVDEVIKVLPRITLPTLTAHECAHMDPADFMQLGGAVAGFLLTKAQREMGSHGE